MTDPAYREFHNLALIGFMGSGKSSVGHGVAAELQFDFLDTDEFIEAQTGKSITRIFAEDGEAVFRQLERALVNDLQHRRRLVIATGGGLVTHSPNLESLKSHALVVCLWASASTIWERVRHQSHRPLLQTADPEGRIRDLLKQREAFYRQADVLVATDARPLRGVIQHVLAEFRAVHTRSTPL